VEDRIATVNEIFRLQDADEYSAAEKIYSRPAAGRLGDRAGGEPRQGLEAVTEDKPKVMLPVAGKPLLRWLVDGFKNQGQRHHRGGRLQGRGDRHGGHQAGAQRAPRADRRAGVARGAADALKNDTVISYGDLLFRSYILRDLVESDAEFSVVVDSSRNRTRACAISRGARRPTTATCSARRRICNVCRTGIAGRRAAAAGSVC
jgi:phosphoenolpyruvate phosphomutase